MNQEIKYQFLRTKNPLVRGEDQRVKKGKGLVKLKQAEYLLSGSCHI